MIGKELKYRLYLINRCLNAVCIIPYILSVLNSEYNNFILNELNFPKCFFFCFLIAT